MPNLRRLLSIIALSCTFAAAARDVAPYWHPRALVDGLSEYSAFDPVQVLRDGDGYLLVDRDRRVYTDADLTPLRQARNHYSASASQRVAALPGDALMSMDQSPDPYCQMYRVGPSGTLDWMAGTIEAGCEVANADRFGTLFTSDYFGVHAYPADGRPVLLQAAGNAGAPSTSTHATDDGGALIFRQSGNAMPEIHRYAADLFPVRSMPALRLFLASRDTWSTTWASRHAHVALAATTYDKLRVLRVDPFTAESWLAFAEDALPGAAVLALSVDQSGRISTLLSDQVNQLRILQIDHQFNARLLRAAFTLDCSYFQFTLQGCALTSVGEHTYWIEHDDNGQAHLYRVTGDGEPQVIWRSQRPVGSIAFGANGSIVAIVGDATGRFSDFDDAPNRQIVRIAPEPADGITTHSPLVGAGGIEPSVVQYVHLDGGDVLELSQGPVDYAILATSRARPWSMRRIGSDGQVSWHQRFTDDGYYFRFDANATQACARVHGTVASPNGAGGRLRCLATTNGSLLMDRTIDGTVAPNTETIVTSTPGKVYINLRVNAADSSPELMKLMLLEGNDTARDIVLTDLAAVHGVGHDGRFAVAFGSAGAINLVQIDATGMVGAVRSLPATVQSVSSLAFDAGGVLWMIFASNDAFGPRIGRVGADARFIDALQPTVFGPRIEQVVATTRGHLIRIGTNGIDFSPVMPPTGVVLVGTDGGLRWQYSVSGQERIESMRVAGERAQLLGWKNTAAYLADIDPANGSETRRTELALPFAYSRFGSSRLPYVVQAEHDRVLTVHRKPARVVLGEAGVAAPIDVASGAPALDGAWQLADLSGKGLVLAYHSANRTLSGAWFTHDGSQGDVGHAALRWNTMIGSVEPDATSVTLAIYENRGGAFDAGPVTAGIMVGNATLTLSDCDHATLAYEFADSRVPPRSVPLTRASLRSRACTPQNGALQPPAYVPRSDIAGAWYDPATSGQGLHIAVYPAPGFAADQPESLGLGWFTYDPADAADEPTQQHWFTASGRFDDASQSNATLTIYRTTGGNRDMHGSYNTHPVGTATLVRDDCDSATFSYVFPDTALAAGFSGRTGTMALSRLGGCATP